MHRYVYYVMIKIIYSRQRKTTPFYSLLLTLLILLLLCHFNFVWSLPLFFSIYSCIYIYSYLSRKSISSLVFFIPYFLFPSLKLFIIFCKRVLIRAILPFSFLVPPSPSSLLSPSPKKSFFIFNVLFLTNVFKHKPIIKQ